MIEIKENVPLKNYTTFRIGGPARFLVAVKSEEELIEALNYAKGNNLPFFILGGGSNLLVSDRGFDGLVIKNKLLAFSFQLSACTIEAGAGVPLALAVNKSVENNLTGLEWAAGIPGTVGGAVRGNAGAFGGSMGDIVEKVKVLEISNDQFLIPNQISNPKSQIPNKLQIKNYKLQDCQFGYRTSIFKQNKNLIILSATIKLKSGNKEESQKKIKEIIAKRIAKQPKAASAGSYFLNPVVTDQKLLEEFEHDRGIKCKDDKLPAGWLIDQAGLRGKKIGGAMVSEEHTNFIVNTGAATAEDVIMLVSVIKQQVRDKFRVELIEETQYLGF